MKRDQFTDKLDAFVSGEMSRDERQAVAEHLLVCEQCRREHDDLKLAVVLLSKLPAASAPGNVWAGIENKLDGRATSPIGPIERPAPLTWRKGFAFAFSLAIVLALAVVIYISMFAGKPAEIAHEPRDSPAVLPSIEPPPVNIVPEPEPAVNSVPPAGSNANDNSLPRNSPALSAAPSTPPSWPVETLAGAPTVGDGVAAGKIALGQMIETDARSKAKITVADIGTVEVAPNSRVRFVDTGARQHRLALERGQLQARILAPPRLFVVDTPSGQAVDLGCEYTLKVDRVGNSILHVTSGFVALEDQGRESIVPAGMMCLTRKGTGLGTPFAVEADAALRRALERFDFDGGGRSELQTILAKSDFYDMVTLWHLLSRVAREERAAVFDRLADLVAPPNGVTKEGILNLDKKMLAAWRTEVENSWFN